MQRCAYHCHAHKRFANPRQDVWYCHTLHWRWSGPGNDYRKDVVVMPYQIRKAAVLGAGVMGAAIAAHLANVGIPSLLLDIVPAGAGQDRDQVARMGLEKAINARPAAFYSKEAAKLITVGNIEDDLGELASVDWIIEAVVERLDIKRSLFSRVERVL